MARIRALEAEVRESAGAALEAENEIFGLEQRTLQAEATLARYSHMVEQMKAVFQHREDKLEAVLKHHHQWKVLSALGWKAAVGPVTRQFAMWWLYEANVDHAATVATLGPPSPTPSMPSLPSFADLPPINLSTGALREPRDVPEAEDSPPRARERAREEEEGAGEAGGYGGPDTGDEGSEPSRRGQGLRSGAGWRQLRPSPAKKAKGGQATGPPRAAMAYDDSEASSEDGEGSSSDSQQGEHGWRGRDENLVLGRAAPRPPSARGGAGGPSPRPHDPPVGLGGIDDLELAKGPPGLRPPSSRRRADPAGAHTPHWDDDDSASRGRGARAPPRRDPAGDEYESDDSTEDDEDGLTSPRGGRSRRGEGGRGRRHELKDEYRRAKKGEKQTGAQERALEDKLRLLQNRKLESEKRVKELVTQVNAMQKESSEWEHQESRAAERLAKVEGQLSARSGGGRPGPQPPPLVGEPSLGRPPQALQHSQYKQAPHAAADGGMGTGPQAHQVPWMSDHPIPPPEPPHQPHHPPPPAHMDPSHWGPAQPPHQHMQQPVHMQQPPPHFEMPFPGQSPGAGRSHGLHESYPPMGGQQEGSHMFGGLEGGPGAPTAWGMGPAHSPPPPYAQDYHQGQPGMPPPGGMAAGLEGGPDAMPWSGYGGEQVTAEEGALTARVRALQAKVDAELAQKRDLRVEKDQSSARGHSSWGGPGVGPEAEREATIAAYQDDDCLTTRSSEHTSFPGGKGSPTGKHIHSFLRGSEAAQQHGGEAAAAQQHGGEAAAAQRPPEPPPSARPADQHPSHHPAPTNEAGPPLSFPSQQLGPTAGTALPQQPGAGLARPPQLPGPAPAPMYPPGGAPPGGYPGAPSPALSAENSAASTTSTGFAGTGASAKDSKAIFSKVRNGRSDDVAAMLQSGEVTADALDKFGNTILIVAAQNNRKRIAKIGVKVGTPLNAQNNQGQTALHYCFAYGYFELGEWLISKGADATLRNHKGQTPYDGAAEDRRIEQLEEQLNSSRSAKSDRAKSERSSGKRSSRRKDGSRSSRRRDRDKESASRSASAGDGNSSSGSSDASSDSDLSDSSDEGN